MQHEARFNFALYIQAKGESPGEAEPVTGCAEGSAGKPRTYDLSKATFFFDF